MADQNELIAKALGLARYAQAHCDSWGSGDCGQAFWEIQKILEGDAPRGINTPTAPSVIAEPQIHAVLDCLPHTHPLAYLSLYCDRCGKMIHAFNNEFMDYWVETGLGNFCLHCFLVLFGETELPDEIGLSVEAKQ